MDVQRAVPQQQDHSECVLLHPVHPRRERRAHSGRTLAAVVQEVQGEKVAHHSAENGAQLQLVRRRLLPSCAGDPLLRFSRLLHLHAAALARPPLRAAGPQGKALAGEARQLRAEAMALRLLGQGRHESARRFHVPARARRRGDKHPLLRERRRRPRRQGGGAEVVAERRLRRRWQRRLGFASGAEAGRSAGHAGASARAGRGAIHVFGRQRGAPDFQRRPVTKRSSDDPPVAQVLMTFVACGFLLLVPCRHRRRPRRREASKPRSADPAGASTCKG
mmetsp:Transcript_770/g.2462  ORF Transcript_770/g.2462 Transcript_770/m.2462 type:complete len:277 (-) Transcript_770:9-839(-)